MKTKMGNAMLGAMLAVLLTGSATTLGFVSTDYTWITNPANGHQYAITLDWSNWLQAEAWAEEVGGHLVTINDAQENTWLSTNFAGYYPRCNNEAMRSIVWIGLERDSEYTDEWFWASGEPLIFGKPTSSVYPQPPWYQPSLGAGPANVHAYLHTDTYLPVTNIGTWWIDPVYDDPGSPWYGIRGIIEIPEPPVIVSIDIKPGSCPNPLNVKDKGLLSVAICGSPDFDVWTIDVASIRLEGVAPVRSSYEDVATPMPDGAEACECTTAGPDGLLDLTLKFKIQDIVAALGTVNNGDELELTLTGALDEAFGGTPIQGTDCVVIQGAK